MNDWSYWSGNWHVQILATLISVHASYHLPLTKKKTRNPKRSILKDLVKVLPNWSHFAHYFTYRSVWGAQPILAISLQCCRNMMDVRLSHPAIVWFPYHSVSPGIRNQGHACPETRILGLSCLKTPTQEHVCPKILTLKSKKINKIKFLSLSFILCL